MGGDSRLFSLTLDDTNYTIWKSRVKAYTMGKKYTIWNAIVNGFKSNFDDFTKLDKEVNVRARNILLATINSIAHSQVSSCKMAKRFGTTL